MKRVLKSNIFWSILCSTFVAGTALASSIMGTNLSTTGTFSVSAGLATFDGGVSVSTNFEVTGNKRVGINAGAVTETTLEVGGAASISGAFTFGNGSGTGAISTSDWAIDATGVMTGISGITNDGVYTQTGTSANTFTGLSSFSGGVSVSTNFEVTGNRRVGINAGAVTEATLEVGGTASVSQVFGITDIVAGNNAASNSSTYVAEFASSNTAASTSVLFGGGSSSLGTCIQMRDTLGNWVYGRVKNSAANALTFSAVKCHN